LALSNSPTSHQLPHIKYRDEDTVGEKLWKIGANKVETLETLDPNLISTSFRIQLNPRVLFDLQKAYISRLSGQRDVIFVEALERFEGPPLIQEIQEEAILVGERVFPRRHGGGHSPVCFSEN